MFSILDSNTYTVLAQLFFVGGIVAFFWGARSWAARVRLGERLDTFVAPELPSLHLRSAFDEPSFRSRAVIPAVVWLSQLAEGLLPDRQIERIRKNLAIAGLPFSRHLSQFLAAQIGLAFGAATLSALYVWTTRTDVLMGVLLVVASLVLGYYLPIIWLGRRMGQRKRAILKALPDALDLLSISVSAGLGLDGAMLEVIQRWDNSLTFEFAAVIRDMKLGTSRRDALRAFARRTEVDEVTQFIAAIVQADELGAPIREVLVIQAEQIRMQRRHRAEETARKATIKMLIPMVFFIFPAMFIVLLGPAVPSFELLFSAAG
jgi:tight adherence protein C